MQNHLKTLPVKFIRKLSSQKLWEIVWYKLDTISAVSGRGKWMLVALNLLKVRLSQLEQQGKSSLAKVTGRISVFSLMTNIRDCVVLLRFIVFFPGCSCRSMGSWTASCHWRSSSRSSPKNGGQGQDPLHFNLSHGSQCLERRGKPNNQLFRTLDFSLSSLISLTTQSDHCGFILKSEAQRAYPRTLGHEAAGYVTRN